MITILLSSETKYQILPEIIFLSFPQQKRLNYKEFKLFTIFTMDKYQERQKAEKDEEKGKKDLLKKKRLHQVNVSLKQFLGINVSESRI